ncbi:MAG: methionine aminotransferase [Bacteroidota bacterium]
MPPHISLNRSKLPEVGTTIFTVMSALANKHNAINLSQGFPDFGCDPKLIQKVQRAMSDGHNQYAPMPGLLRLRSLLSNLQNEWYQAHYEAETEITISSGATESLMCAIQAMVHPGDEVIVIEPAYDSYIPAIQLSGGIPIRVPLTYPTYRVDWEKIRAAINPKTRVMLINTPHNPTGTIWEDSDLEILAEIVRDTEIILISDEVYEHILFDGKQHQSLSRHPELAKRSMVISSFGKTLHTTGWKVGYCMAPAELTKEFRKVHQFVTFSTSTPFQHAIADYLEEELEQLITLKDFYQQKRDLFLQLMEGSRFQPLACQGTYFQLMTYADISDEEDAVFAQRLIREYGVAAIPVSAFYHHPPDHRVVRFCFAKKEETLVAAAEKLRKI